MGLLRTFSAKEDVTLPKSTMRINSWVGILLLVASIGAEGDNTAVGDLEETKEDVKRTMAQLKRSNLDLNTSDETAVGDLEETKTDLKRTMAALRRSDINF